MDGYKFLPVVQVALYQVAFEMHLVWSVLLFFWPYQNVRMNSLSASYLVWWDYFVSYFWFCLLELDPFSFCMMSVLLTQAMLPTFFSEKILWTDCVESQACSQYEKKNWTNLRTLVFFSKKKRFFVRIPKKNIILQVCDQISEVYLFLTMICVDVLFGFLMENPISSTAFQSYEWQKKGIFFWRKK